MVPHPSPNPSPLRARRLAQRDVLRTLRRLNRHPPPAESAARHAAHRHRPGGATPRPPSAEERETLAAIRRAISDTPSTATQQWRELSAIERSMLAAYAGLREHNPGESLGSIAARDWGEFSPFERTAINQAVRNLLIRLGRMVGLRGEK